MDRTILKLLVVTFCFVFGGVSFAEDAPNLTSPLGYWKTIDDISGKPRSIIYISENQNSLQGKVVQIFPRPGHTIHDVCTECKGENSNKPILGMTILKNLQASESQWQNGEILDPANGKTYKCNIRLTDNGKHLNVKGYIGIPLFGRSQTWERVSGVKA